jgi:hypothetical protein
MDGVNKARQVLPDILKDYDHADIFNMDESALFWRQTLGKTLCFKAGDGHKQERQESGDSGTGMQLQGGEAEASCHQQSAASPLLWTNFQSQ